MYGCFVCHRKNYVYVFFPVLLQHSANVLTSKEGNENSSRTPTFSALKYNPCEEVKRTFTEEAPVTIYTSQGHKELLCDTETDGGRWLYIQKHTNGDTDFNKSWAEYAQGFGNISADFWLVHQLTSWDDYELMIEMAYEDNWYFAKYKKFRIGDEANQYKLYVHAFLDGYSFSTPDRDNDDSHGHCSRSRNSGWWYHDCQSVNLNSKFVKDWGKGAYWHGLTSEHGTLTSTEMKMRIRL